MVIQFAKGRINSTFLKSRGRVGWPRSKSETLLNSVESILVIFNFFEVLCTVRLWSKSYFLQNMHRLVTPKSKTFWGQDSSLFGWLRIQKSAFFTSHVIVREWRILRKIELKQLWKCCWIAFHEYTVKCWHSKTGTQYLYFHWLSLCLQQLVAFFLIQKCPLRWEKRCSKGQNLPKK